MLKTTYVDSHICLRMAMKFQDHQEKMFKSYVTIGSEMLSPYQHLLNKITSILIEGENQFFDRQGRPDTDDNEQTVNWLSEEINKFIQIREYEVLFYCDLNLNTPTGSEIFESILKMSNPNYDFSDTIKVVD